jgi:hypothetical protein
MSWSRGFGIRGPPDERIAAENFGAWCGNVNVQRPIFIVGAPRSGTTLLQVMLGQIAGLYITPETKFLVLTMMRRRSLGSLNEARGFENTLAAIRHNVCEWRELPVELEELESELRNSPREYADLFDTLLYHIQRRRPNCRRIGEKSPNHIHVVEYLLTHFRDGQVINILRDGRDVLVSQREAFNTELVNSAYRWRYYVRLHERLAQRLRVDQYTSVKYEDLVASPESEMRRLCHFLREEYSPETLEHHKRSDVGFTSQEAHKIRTLEPITLSRVGRYREALSRREIAVYQAIAGRELRRLGYPLEKVSKVVGYLGALSQLPLTLGRRLQHRWSRFRKDPTQDYRNAGSLRSTGS